MASTRSRTVGWACAVLGVVGMLGCRPTLEPRVPHEDPADPSAPGSTYRPSPNVFEGSAFDGETLEGGGHGGHHGHGAHEGHEPESTGHGGHAHEGDAEAEDAEHGGPSHHGGDSQHKHARLRKPWGGRA